MAESMTAVHDAGWIRVELAIRIAAARERVFEAITQETDAWWLADFYATANPETIVFEAEPGGRVYETSADGGGLLWFHVQSIVPNESLHLTGQLAPPFGGPATTLLHLALRDDGDGTVLEVTDCLFGNVDETTRANLESGWRMLFGDGLAKHVESGASPQASQTR